MKFDEQVLRSQLTEAMADAVDEGDAFEAYFGEPTRNADYGVARADGTLPADLVFLWEFAGYITDYIAVHGVDALGLVEQVGNLFVAYQAVKKVPTDYDEGEKEKIKQAVSETLRELIETKK